MPTSAIEFIDLREVCRRVCFQKSAIYCLIRNGEFPHPVKIGRKASRWDAAEIDTWQREQLARRAALRGRFK